MTERALEVTTHRDMLRETGFAPLPFAVEGADIDPLFAQFREFSELAWAPDGSGQELVEAMHYTIPGREDDGDYFMVHRRIGEKNPFSPRATASTENKDLLHFGPLSYILAKDRLGKRMPGVMKDLLEGCVELHEAVKTSVRPIFEELGIADIMLAETPRHDIHMVRILRYLGTEATHKADLHFDRSVATFAAWESSPGLVGAPGNNALAQSLSVSELEALMARADASPLDHISGEGKFFLGAGYNHLPQAVHERNGSLPLLAHGVINEQAEAERDAVVVFMNPHRGFTDYTVPEKEETSIDHLRQVLTDAKAA